jgi:hypothetical protein
MYSIWLRQFRVQAVSGDLPIQFFNKAALNLGNVRKCKNQHNALGLLRKNGQ